ncbi:hypothetical protein [Salinibacterium sp. dk2585]|uniref:hypothetical protein n=1 Tax=Salinibacterium sp. dk2585 TaxID=2603292 RepID=UPI00143D76F7|nr:hypothetical protein [Salinibacterium sp. dk2585]
MVIWMRSPKENAARMRSSSQRKTLADLGFPSTIDSNLLIAMSAAFFFLSANVGPFLSRAAPFSCAGSIVGLQTMQESNDGIYYFVGNLGRGAHLSNPSALRRTWL